MIKKFGDHTCINLSMELNCHLTTPFPAMNKSLLSSIDCMQSSKIGVNKNKSDSADLELSSSNGDVTETQLTVECCHHNDIRKVSCQLSSTAVQLLETLEKAVMKRVTLIPSEHKCFEHKPAVCSYNYQATVDARVAILFSGGVDSMVLAALVDR